MTMFGIGGFSPVSLLATSMMGPMGGMITQLATQIFSQMGQQLIQQMGNNMGLPQSTIDMAQGAFAGTHGDFAGQFSNLDEAISAAGQEFGAPPADVGDAQRQANRDMQRLLNDLSEGDDVREARQSRGGGGWLMAMAKVLGEKLDRLAHDMETKASQVSESDPSTSTEFTVVSQQFNMLMNATTNALKTIGEAMGKSAGRQ
jgi:hypothetical protein